METKTTNTDYDYFFFLGHNTHGEHTKLLIVNVLDVRLLDTRKLCNSAILVCFYMGLPFYFCSLLTKSQCIFEQVSE